MIESLDHIVIAVEDIAAAERTAALLLGRSPSWSGSHPSYGTRNSIFKLENSYVELLAPEDDGPVADGLRTWMKEHGGPGLWALALGTSDADAEVARLREAGLRPTDPMPGVAQDEQSGAFRRFRNAFLPTDDTNGIGMFIIEHLSEPELLPPSLPISDEAGVASRIDHVVVMTADPERARSFYGDRLGIRLALDRTFEKRGVRLIFFRVGGTTIEVGARLRGDHDDRGNRALGEADDSGDNLWGVAYQVPDIDKAHARLVDAGVDVTPVRNGHKPGTRVCSLEGNPLGVPTLIIEPVQD